jgi:hypothetical protein
MDRHLQIVTTIKLLTRIECKNSKVSRIIEILIFSKDKINTKIIKMMTLYNVKKKMKVKNMETWMEEKI